MRAVLVFCEGKHDVVFVERSLGACANCERMDRSIRELPSPFGTSRAARGLIAQRLGELAVEDLELRDSYPPTPQFESVVEHTGQGVMFVLIRAGGKTNARAVLKLIEQADELVRVGVFDVTEHAVAFLFDADDAGRSATVSAFRSAYAPYYGDLDSVDHAGWSGTRTTPVGLYVFHAEDKETGTLEDHVAPMVQSEWPEEYNAAIEFIDQNSRPMHAVSNNDARRLKAAITAAGQFDHPGRPLVTILARRGLPDERYKASSAANDLASFLLETPWPSTRGANNNTATSAAVAHR